ncbi:MAG: ATP-binding protein [Gemmataceae bacterium]
MSYVPPVALGAAQSRVLERLAAGASLADTLAALVVEIERLLPDTIGSILLLDDGQLRFGAAPNLPDEYNRTIDAVAIGPRVGSCGTAAYRNQAVVVTDIAVDPLWTDFAPLAIAHGLRACWSTPIRGRTGGVLGTFALYYREPRGPGTGDRELVEGFASLAAVAIELYRAAAEREQAEARLRHAQKLESLGLLAGGIAHDFNNLLTAILGYAGLALEQIPKESAAVTSIRGIEAVSQRAAGLVQQILAYAGKASVSARPLDLSHLIRDTEHLVRAAVAKTATLVLNLAEGLPPVEGDPDQLRQVIVNLLTNASDALGTAAGTVIVRTGSRELADPAHYSPYAQADQPPGKYAFVEVRDGGCGMTTEIKARIFDPFFSTKFAGRGLGLAATQGIVRGHRGLIRVESEPGRGTTVEVLFPAVVDVPRTKSTPMTPLPS